MLPVNLSAITSAFPAASSPATGAVSAPATNGADFTAKLGSLGAEYGGQSIPLTGGVATPSTTTATQAIGGGLSNTINEPTTFGHLAQQMIQDVNQKQQVAGALVRDVLAGGPTPVHQALIATEEASVSFQVLTEARNKVVEAYQEVMRMTV